MSNINENSIRLPDNCIMMSDEEMEYLEGGGIKCSVLSGMIDVAIILSSLGLGGIATFASTGGKRLLVKNWTKVAKTVSKVIGGFDFLGAMSNALLRALECNASWLNYTTIGGIIAYGVDKLDSKRNNGIAFG